MTEDERLFEFRVPQITGKEDMHIGPAGHQPIHQAPGDTYQSPVLLGHTIALTISLQATDGMGRLTPKVHILPERPLWSCQAHSPRSLDKLYSRQERYHHGRSC